MLKVATLSTIATIAAAWWAADAIAALLSLA
jgi:hypothetical protein